MTPLNLIDISHWESVDSWEDLMKAGIAGVYTKATQGIGFKDPKLTEFIKGANSVGMPFGVYHVIETSHDIESQVNFFTNTVSSGEAIKVRLRDAIDFETEVNKSWSSVLNKAACLSMVDLLAKRNGYKSIFYCNTGDLRAFQFSDSEAATFDMWLANYSASSLPGPVAGVKTYLMWQHTDKKETPGAGKVDSDYLYAPIESLIVHDGRLDDETPPSPRLSIPEVVTHTPDPTPVVVDPVYPPPVSEDEAKPETFFEKVEDAVETLEEKLHLKKKK